ncbi:alpha-glucuronidase family glycosyl hydrolase [Martelella sp. HB161492]|uniref:alpha-glucuronidase family glycosyl hydrolase n=1 Tax=Martelella sp. HB161492 TaxID=2720726 RepID=UPI001AEDF5AB|nr:alpha-glucuronidase family glycosyl hydrolase [Martelella sp. HB161492]
MNTLLSHFMKLEADARGETCAATLTNEDGYDLWLRYLPQPEDRRTHILEHASMLIAGADSPTILVAQEELEHALFAMTLHCVPKAEPSTIGDGAIIIGTPEGNPLIASAALPLDDLGPEGYLVRRMTMNGCNVTAIAAGSDTGVLYGCFAFLRHIQTGRSLAATDLRSRPKLDLRLLNHWDNLDGTVERGYAGFSIWDWWTLPDYQQQRYTDYARANASLGINGTVLNNVNAAPEILTPFYLEKAAMLAAIFRPFGLKVFLSVNFASPAALGECETADPSHPDVQSWWQNRVNAIYAAIPDFGGFLVKANSEGQPGPGDYQRSHAEGANMIAEALAPHGGILIWRAFVYASDAGTDRAGEALNEFAPLDGHFAPNVLVQVKNGPIDFQPREPFSPIFGKLTKTPLVMEFQITKEYLGQATHLAFLGPVFEEVLQFDTLSAGRGSTISKILQGKLFPQRLTGMSGVANIGSDRDWTGGIFNQANWYAFGRMAWDPDDTARAIAEDWTRMTFSNEAAFVSTIVDMLMQSHEILVDYMMPFGLHHQVATGHHYGPGPWVNDLARAEWNPTYYNRADSAGIGFNRLADGSNSIGQYSEEMQALFSDPHAFDERYLLWFHHIPWDFRMKSGKSLWQSLIERFDRGAEAAAVMAANWSDARPYVDGQRFKQVNAFLAIQAREARWWRDANIAYFQAISGLPLPTGYAAPQKGLETYKALSFPFAPGNPD